MQLFKDIYQKTESWPRAQVFGLIMDIRRAAMGISSNLGEVYKHSWNDFLEFLTISQETLAELRTHLLVAREYPALLHNDIESLLQQTADLGDKLQRLAVQT